MPRTTRTHTAVATGLSLAVLLSGLATIAGCGGTPLPAEKPQVVNAWVNIIGPTDAGPSLTVDVTGSATITVGTGRVEFCANLDSAATSNWFKVCVKVRGAKPEPQTQTGRQVSFSFSKGRPGEVIVITLASVTLAGGEDGPLVLTLRRAEPPAASLKATAADGTWREVTSGDVLPEGPVHLLLSFTREMDRTGVLAALATTGLGPAVSWNPDGTVSLVLDAPPPLIRIDLWEARDTLGLPLANGGMWDFYVGEPPQLYSFDPAKGLEQPVCELMTDICAATVSPDGRTLLAQSYERPWGSPTRSWLVALGDGTRRALEGVFHPGWVGADADLLLRIRWTATPSGPTYDLLTAGGETRRQGSLPGGIMRLPFRLSPDGKRLAVLVSRRSAAGSEDLVRNDLLVLDVGTGEQRMFEDFVRIYDPPSTYQTSDGQWVSSVVPRGSAYSNLAWSPDPCSIAAVSHLEEKSAIRILDLATWQASEVPLPGVERGAWNAFSWSPDGRLWIGGPFAVETAAPNPTRDLALSGTGELLWSGDGVWLARNESPDGWGELKTYRVDSTTGLVLERSLGPAFPCGWDESGLLYYVRWPDADQRFVEGEGY